MLWQIVTTCTAAEVKLRIASTSRITTVSVGHKGLLAEAHLLPFSLRPQGGLTVK